MEGKGRMKGRIDGGKWKRWVLLSHFIIWDAWPIGGDKVFRRWGHVRHQLHSQEFASGVLIKVVLFDSGRCVISIAAVATSQLPSWRLVTNSYYIRLMYNVYDRARAGFTYTGQRNSKIRYKKLRIFLTGDAYIRTCVPLYVYATACTFTEIQTLKK